MKRLVLALAFSALVSLSARAQVLANFGTASFSPDLDVSSFDTITQTGSTTTIEGFDNGQTLAGYFSTTLDFSSVTTLYLTASITGTAPDSTFTVLLYNSDFTQTLTYQGAFNDYNSALSSYALTLMAQDSAFTDVAGFQFIGNGSGAGVRVTLASLGTSAVPEPSTYAALAGLAALGLAAWRRRRLTRH